MAKPTEIFSPASGAAGDLLHFADRQVREVARLANAGLRDHDRPCREIDSGRQRGRGEDGIQTAVPHQFFNGDFPGGQMPCMMRGHADALDGRNQAGVRRCWDIGRSPALSTVRDRPPAEAGGRRTAVWSKDSIASSQARRDVRNTMAGVRCFWRRAMIRSTG